MSIYHKDKCIDKEIKNFRQTVKDFIDTEIRITTYKLRGLKSYGGEVRVYSGKKTSRMPTKMRRRLVAYKDPDDKWQGNKDAILKAGDRGDRIYERHNEPIIELEYFSVFREDWGVEEKAELKRWLETIYK